MANITHDNNMQRELEVSLSQRMAEFEERLQAAMEPSTPTLLQLSHEFQAFKELVSNMLSLLQKQVTRCVNSMDEMDMRQRRKMLLFNGIAENPEVNLENEVLGLIQNKMGLSNVDRSSLKRCHRLGSHNNNNKVRPVLVHFHEYQVKSDVWRSKSKLKGTSFTVTEFLTKIRQEIYIKSRKHFGIKNVWSLNGIIYTKLPDKSRAKIITEEDFKCLVVKWSSTSSAVLTESEIRPATPQSISKCTRPQDVVIRRNPGVSAPVNNENKKTRRVISKK